MFGIHWLHGRTVIEKQTSQLMLLADVVADARINADVVSARHSGHAPDTFKVFDELGREMGQFTLAVRGT